MEFLAEIIDGQKDIKTFRVRPSHIHPSGLSALGDEGGGGGGAFASRKIVEPRTVESDPRVPYTSQVVRDLFLPATRVSGSNEILYS